MSDPTNGISAELTEELKKLAHNPQLLVACDYDGTMAPIVDDPMAAYPHRESIVALRALAALPQTHVAVISGRALRDLATLSRLPDEVHLVGSHGGEFDIDFAHNLPDDLSALRNQITAELTEIAERHPEIQLEHKPASVALHYRGLTEDAAQAVLESIEAGPAAHSGVTTQHGKMVCELLVTETNKGDALDKIRNNVGAGAVLFAGDDVTDESAFEKLRGPDLGIKVGPGDTSARFRVPDTTTVAQVLAELSELRAEWLSGAGLVPIEQHSMLSDNRTVSIVTPDARVSWMCVPRVDSAAIFSELLGGPSAGYFSVAPATSSVAPKQRYLDDTMILETAWADMKVTDFLDCTAGRPGHLAGRTDLIRHIAGKGEAIIEFAPRLDFGRRVTHLDIREGGLEVVGAPDLIVLRSPGIEWEIVNDGLNHTARATVQLSEDPIVLDLRCGTASLKADPRDGQRLEETHRYWQKWSDKLTPPSDFDELTTRSALVLKALCQRPTGAIVAAATTSLPETLGGIRNWDYRYCWLRDGALTASALVSLGSQHEAMDFLDWVLNVLENRAHGPERLAPLYQVSGSFLPPEAEIGELAGYGGSRPVRIGNAADGQIQLDVFGPIVDLVYRLGATGAPLSTSHLQLVDAMVGAVEARWKEPDHGIWEIRKLPRHHVYSKTMCWLTVDRAIEISSEFFGRERPEWHELRSEIADDILEHGFDESVGSFTAAYDGDDLDASVLMVGICGLLEPTDPRFVSTVDAVEKTLRNGPTVYRYLEDDGLPGEEGGFNLMTSWLIDAYVLVGRDNDARALFDELVRLAGDTGLMAEEFDPETARALGNHPQAYSHLGVIFNALRLAESAS